MTNAAATATLNAKNICGDHYPTLSSRSRNAPLNAANLPLLLLLLGLLNWHFGCGVRESLFLATLPS
jgi:hypothetical protein